MHGCGEMPERVIPATPADVVRSVLARSAWRSSGTGHGTGLPGFQEEAVHRAVASMERWRGAIVADATGTGKTHVALAIIAEALASDLRVALITPASLRAHWARRLDTIEARRRIVWVTHAWLSRHGALHTRPDLVVVDEAHAFRNPATRRYRALAESCGPRVLLLTATPVNNSPLDVYNLIRLFAADGTFAFLGVASLRNAFHAAARGEWSSAADAVLAAVVVRRSRAEARAAAGSVLRFPQRAPPRAIEWRPHAGRWSEGVRRIASLEFAALQAGATAARRGSSEIVRLLLLKRLESGRAAFHATVHRLAEFHADFVNELDAGRLLTPADRRSLADGAQLAFGALLLKPFPSSLDAPALRAAALRDLEQLRALAEDHDDDRDPKCTALVDLLRTELRGRRTLVFTEFRDTAEELWRKLRNRFRVALVHGGGAWIGSGPATRAAALALFAPSAARHAVTDADVLIATDVLAEGLDLQGANAVVSYDLPWNPVRLIQRIGRIDRIGSPHDRIDIFNFMPADGLEAVLGLLRRLRAKIGAIDRAIGGEPAVLECPDPDRLAELVARIREGDEALLDDVEDPIGALRSSTSDPFPCGSIPVATTTVTKAVMVAVEADGITTWLTTSEERTEDVLRRALSDHGPPPDEARTVAIVRAARGIVRNAPVVPDSGGPAAAMSRLLLRTLAATQRPSPDLIRRCETLLSALAAGASAARESDLRRMLRDPPTDADRLCVQIEALNLASPRPAGRIRILGILAPTGFGPQEALRE